MGLKLGPFQLWQSTASLFRHGCRCLTLHQPIHYVPVSMHGTTLKTITFQCIDGWKCERCQIGKQKMQDSAICTCFPFQCLSKCSCPHESTRQNRTRITKHRRKKITPPIAARVEALATVVCQVGGTNLRNKKLLGAPGLTTRNKDATRSFFTCA